MTKRLGTQVNLLIEPDLLARATRLAPRRGRAEWMRQAILDRIEREEAQERLRRRVR